MNVQNLIAVIAHGRFAALGLRGIAAILVVVLLPGGTLILPLVSWWLLRRPRGVSTNGSAGRTPPAAA